MKQGTKNFIKTNEPSADFLKKINTDKLLTRLRKKEKIIKSEIKELLCYIPETNTTLLSNYTPIQK